MGRKKSPKAVVSLRIRRGVRTLLGSLPELEVIGEAAGGLEALKLAEELLPDVIVLDISMPDMNGLDVARRLRQVTPKSRILFMSQHSSAQVVQEALRTGACGYILKSDAASDLVSGLRAQIYVKRICPSFYEQVGGFFLAALWWQLHFLHRSFCLDLGMQVIFRRV